MRPFLFPHPFRRGLVLAGLLGAAAAAAPFGGVTYAADSAAPRRTIREVAAGVRLIQEITPAAAPDGPLVVTVLQVDVKAPGVRVEAALGQDRVWGADPTQGREAVSRLAARRKAVAGINAGFFPFAGNPIGIHFEGGDLVTEPNSRTAVSLLRDNSVRFNRFAYAGTARAPGGAAYSISGLNRRPGKDDTLLLYTPRFFHATLPAPGRVEAVLSGIAAPLVPGREYTGTVTSLAEGGATPLAAGTAVVSGGGAAAAFLRNHLATGATLTFRLDQEALGDGGAPVWTDWSRVRDAVAGGPRLLTEGRVTINAAEERFSADFVGARHPRTAVATTQEGALLLVSVDGRQKTLSRGASLPELAAILLKFGAWNAVNMDGGGSTALVTRDTLANSPSDGRERPVANALLVFAPVPSAAPRRPLTLRASAPGRPLTVGESTAFTLTDASGLDLTDHPRAVWGTLGGVGFVDQEGRFRALRSGAGTVQFACGDDVRRARVTVVGAPAPPLPGKATYAAPRP